MITALIINLKKRQVKKELLFESDYSRIIGAIIPHYFKYDDNYTISPEIWSDDRRRADFVISETYLNQNGNYPYGHSIPVLMVESKNRGAIPWKDLASNQLWNEADSLKNDDGRLWVIGQIGFTICFFHFDILNYNKSEWFTNFQPLNLINFSDEDLDRLKIKHITESIGNDDVLQVIEWRLDIYSHHIYIHEMFEHISNNAP